MSGRRASPQDRDPTISQDDDLFTEDESRKPNKELLYAEIENRIRGLVTELLSPALRKATQTEDEVLNLQALVNDHTKKINGMFQINAKVVQTNTTLDCFRDDLVKLDSTVHATVSRCTEDINTLHCEFDALQKNVELKESAICHMQRSLDRCGLELNRILANQDADADRKVYEEQIEDIRKTTHRMVCELEAKIMGMELQQAALTDQLWGEETGLAKVCGEVKRTREALSAVTASVQDLQSVQVKPEHLTHLRNEVNVIFGKTEDEMKVLRSNVGNVVNDTREHFRTALKTVATQHARFMEEARCSYRTELDKAALLRDEVEQFLKEMRDGTTAMDFRIQAAALKAEALLQEHKGVLEDSEKKRKRDISGLDLETKGIQKRLGGIFDSHAMISRGFGHLEGIIGTLLEAFRMQCAFNLQDTFDREQMYLLGLREEGGAPKEHGPPPAAAQSPRKEAKRSVSLSPRKGKATSKAAPARIVHVDQRCLACSGQAPNILSAFKMACLQYNPSPVKYEDEEFPRSDILKRIDVKLADARNLYRAGPSADREHLRGAHAQASMGRGLDKMRASAGIFFDDGQANGQLGGYPQFSLGDYMPLSPGHSKQENNFSRKTSSRGFALPTLHTSRPTSKSGTPRDGTRDSLGTKGFKADMIE